MRASGTFFAPSTWPAAYSPGSRTSTTSASSRLMSWVACAGADRRAAAEAAHERPQQHRAGHHRDRGEQAVIVLLQEFQQGRFHERVIIIERCIDSSAHKLVLLRHGESHLEPRKPLHRLDRRRPLAEGRRRGARRRTPAQDRGLRLRPRLHLGAQARHPHALARARRARPDVAAGGEALAPERAPLRRAAGPEQGRDGGEVRRGAGARLAPQLRHPAAPAVATTMRATKARTRATPASRCRAPSASRTRWRACCRTGAAPSRRRSAPEDAC